MRFKPNGCREYINFVFLVITVTDADDRPPTSKPEWGFDLWQRSQILVCEANNGGYPIEVGTGSKPGKLGYSYETFETMPDAVNRSFEVAEAGWDRKKRGRWQPPRPKRKKKRKPRHRA